MIHIRWMSSVETSYSMGTMNKDDILRLTDRGMAIFKHYLPTPFRVGRNFLNPFYEDKHASCNIYYERRSDTYKMKDFGNDDYSGDCFAFVGKLNGLDCKDSKDFIQIVTCIWDYHREIILKRRLLLPSVLLSRQQHRHPK